MNGYILQMFLKTIAKCLRKHSILRLDAQYSQMYLCAVTFKNNDYGERKSKLSGGI